MAEFNEPQPTPRVGIRGNAEPIKSTQREAALNASTSTPNFIGAFSSLAATPTAIGMIGSQVLTSTSNYFMDKMGYQLGSNPTGDVLPAVTEADKHFVQSYSNQAYATLSLQAEKLMSAGQLELSKANRLTPGLIDSYAGNMAKGFEGLLNNAPSTVRPQLENQLQTNLLRTTTSLNGKLISQQKADYRDQMTALNNQTNKDIYENAMSGNSSAAEKGLETQISRNKQLRESGVISKVQEEQSNQTARQTYFTGIYSEQALYAKANGKVEGFLDSLKEKPKDVTYLEWSTVTKNVLSNIAQVESLERRDQSLIESQFSLAVLENKVSDDMLAELKEKLTPENYTRSMIGYYKATHAKNKNQQDINSLIPNWGSTIAQADATTKTVNDAFTVLTSSYNDKLINEGKQPVSEIEAKIAVMKSSGASVPRFTDEITGMIRSGNPASMAQAANAYDVLGYLKLPIAASDQRLLTSFTEQVSNGRTPLEAAQIAINNNAPKTEEQTKAINSQWKQFQKDHKLNNWDGKVRFAQDLLDIPWFADTPDLAAIVQKTNDDFESNLKLMNFDVQAARKLTMQNKQMTYGISYANGHKQFTYMPIEKFMGVNDDSAAGIIQNNIAPQLMKQLEPTKAAYDAGHNDFYYRVSERADYAKAVAAQEEIQKIMSVKNYGTNYWEKQNRLKELRGIVGEYTSSNPISIEKVYRAAPGHKEYVQKFQVGIKASDTLGLSLNANQPISGAYHIVIKTENGKERDIIGVDNLANGNALFRPDIQKMQTEYFTLLGSHDIEGDIETAKKQFINSNKRNADELSENKSHAYNYPYIR